MVAWWADWSKKRLAQYLVEKGPAGVTVHDGALQFVRNGLAFYGSEPDASAVAGMLLASDLIENNKSVDQETKRYLVRYLRIQVGLAAEAAESQPTNQVFDRIVGSEGIDISSRAKLADRMALRRGGLTGTFSCNAAGDVWRTPGKGLTSLGDRDNLRGSDQHLDQIVQKVLAASPEGGRFEIRVDGVFLVRDLRKVA